MDAAYNAHDLTGRVSARLKRPGSNALSAGFGVAIFAQLAIHWLTDVSPAWPVASSLHFFVIKGEKMSSAPSAKFFLI